MTVQGDRTSSSSSSVGAQTYHKQNIMITWLQLWTEPLLTTKLFELEDVGAPSSLLRTNISPPWCLLHSQKYSLAVRAFCASSCSHSSWVMLSTVIYIHMGGTTERTCFTEICLVCVVKLDTGHFHWTRQSCVNRYSGMFKSRVLAEKPTILNLQLLQRAQFLFSLFFAVNWKSLGFWLLLRTKQDHGLWQARRDFFIVLQTKWVTN